MKFPCCRLRRGPRGGLAILGRGFWCYGEDTGRRCTLSVWFLSWVIRLLGLVVFLWFVGRCVLDVFLDLLGEGRGGDSLFQRCVVSEVRDGMEGKLLV